MPELTTKNGYRAKKSDGDLTIFNVPIFCTCERGEHNFNDEWVTAAVANAKRQQAEGYLPPLHIRHHEPASEMTNSVRPAGFFRITGLGKIRLKGSSRKAIMADLIVTDPDIAAEILSMRLPYRSVEIFDVDVPAIDSLALLDHEAPFLELPMLQVAELEEGSTGPQLDGSTPQIIAPHPLGGHEPSPFGVASATFRSTAASAARDSVVACARRGNRAALLFKNEEVHMAKTPEELAAEKAEADALLNEDGTPAAAKNDATDTEPAEESAEQFAGEPEEMPAEEPEQAAAAPSAPDMANVIQMIQDLMAAVAAITAPAPTPEPPEPPGVEEDEEIAPIAAPGAEVMSKKPTTNAAAFAALAGENAALKTRLDARDAADKRNEDIANAMEQLEGRAIGADTKAEMIAFHKEHGPAAFKPYLAAILKNTPVDIPTDDPRAENFRAQAGKLPEEAMKYLDGDGGSTDKAMRAAHFCREYDAIRHTGIRASKEDYVRRNLEREARVAQDPDSPVVR
jgi:hypothetical protein